MKNKYALPTNFNKNIAGRIARIFGVIVLGMIMTIGAVMALPTEEISAAGPDEADVIVQFPGDNDVIVRRIHFTAPISALKALQLTGLNVISSSGSVCAIEGVGCPASDCFCPDNWWSHWHWDGEWKSDYPFPPIAATGAVEGWRWDTSFESPPPPRPITAAVSALTWLHDQQQSDGGYGSARSSVDTMFALGANEFDAGQWRRDVVSPSLVEYLQADDNAASYAAKSAGESGKLAVALVGVDQNPQNFDGLNLVVSLTNYYSSTTGLFDNNDINQAWAMLGWYAAGQTVPVSATQRLAANAAVNGGWRWSPDFDPDTNTTALAIQALVAGGECLASPNIARGLGYLKAAQNSDGGFTYDPNSIWGTASDVNSTAYVIQSLLAVGEDPTSAKWTVSGSNPISYLLSMQLADGSFEWQTGFGSNLLSTQQAVVALIGRPFPLHVDPPEQSQCFASPSSIQTTWIPVISKQ